jgi:hypothetical protein
VRERGRERERRERTVYFDLAMHCFSWALIYVVRRRVSFVGQ